MNEEEKICCKFVADIPIKLSWRSPNSWSGKAWVFWSQEEEAISQLTSSSTSSVLAIRNHIKAALCSLDCFGFFNNVLVQFWAPTRTTIGSVHVLTTSNEPFALYPMNEDFLRYRKHCHSYECGVGVGIPGRVFINNEYSPDVSYYSIDDYPLRDLALSCGFTDIMALPIFQDHSCVGVLELLFSSVHALDFDFFLHSVFTALEGTGLNVILPEKVRDEQLPKQGADHVEEEEISNALKHACEKCHLQHACVWVRSVKSFEAVTGDPGDELFIEVDKSSINTIFESLKTSPNIGALQNEGHEKTSSSREFTSFHTISSSTELTSFHTISSSQGFTSLKTISRCTEAEDSARRSLRSRSIESTLNNTRRTPNICTRPSGNRSYLDQSTSKINEPVDSETGSSYCFKLFGRMVSASQYQVPTMNVYRGDSSLSDAPHSEASAVFAHTIPPSTMVDVEMVTVNENTRTIPPSTMVDVEMVTVDENYEEEL